MKNPIYPLAMLVGAMAGLGAIAFEFLSGLVSKLTLTDLAGYTPEGPRGEVVLFPHEPAVGDAAPHALWLLLLPAFGCWLSCLLCRVYAPEATGHGTDGAIEAYHHKGGRVRGRVPIIKAICSALTIGTGGSGGREGPIAQIGAGTGSWLGQKLGLRDGQCRVLLAAGMAGGVGAIFRAPFAGALFASEILYRDAEFEGEVVMPSFLSSAVAYCVYCGFVGEFGTLFALGPGFEFERLVELLPYTALALVLVPAIALFTRFFYGTERLFARLPGPRPLVAALGGLLCGGVAILAWWLTGDQLGLSAASNGYGILQESLDGSVLGWEGVRLLLVVALAKIVATSCTIAAGGSGGVFGPSMVVGGAIGGAVGIVGQQLGLVTHPASFVVVGMCGFFAGAAKTPISTIVMVTEMTGSYALLLPAMWVCGLTFLLSRRVALYQQQVPHRALSPAHAGEYQVALLAEMKVADVFEPSEVFTVSAATPLSKIVQLLVDRREDYFPVVDEAGRLVGVFSANDVRQFTFDREIYQLATAADVMTSPAEVVHPGDDLHRAMETFDKVLLDELPVVDDADGERLLGRLRRREINRAYSQKLKELQALQAR
ncbi:MAG: chloride channel protein [bacterium]|nr:chloride channel protein [bacterium]